MNGEPPSAIRGAVGEDGIWGWCAQAPRPGRPRPALFLDRDGVVVAERPYLHWPDDVRLLTGAADAIARANELAMPVVIVTNQSGVGRGYYAWPAFEQVMQRLADLLSPAGARFDAVYACPYHVEALPPWDVPDHPGRKPNPGMLLRASRDLALDLSRSWIVGDAATDVLAGRAAGLEGAVHVLTGHGHRDRQAAAAIREPGFPVLTVQGLADLPGTVLPRRRIDAAA